MALSLSLFIYFSLSLLTVHGENGRYFGDSERYTEEKYEKVTDSERYQEVRERLRDIFSHGVQPGKNIEREFVRDNEVERKRSNFPLSKSLNPIPESLNGAEKRFLEDAEEYTYNYAPRTAYQSQSHPGHEHTRTYLNEWIVHVEGGIKMAETLAKDLGYLLHGQVGSYTDLYSMVKSDHPRMHKRAAPELTNRLTQQDKVVWAEQQFVKERTKRGALDYLPQVPLQDGQNYDQNALLSREKRGAMRRTNGVKGGAKRAKEEREGSFAEHALKMEKLYNDEFWDHQWYLFDSRTRSDLPRLDLQVLSVWEEGFTGEGVNVQILDDGLEWRHEDIIESYEPNISYDLNGNKSDPTPRYDVQKTNSHGTRCGGEIVMKPNNYKCGVGVAYGAKLGAVRMLDGPVSDLIEGKSLEYGIKEKQGADIVSCSWGPKDDGTRVEGPGTLAQMSLKRGVTEGRNGLGTIYVWAAGNGGSAGDNCNCDGYTSSIMTLSISSASQTGKFPWYGERCASTLATAYSSGAYSDQKITTSDLNNTCTVKFSGTSAAAPLAAGIIALALQANPNMTWRDMQHAVIWSSEWGPLSQNTGWQTNARGMKINPRFGFGLINARNLVDVAKNWKNVGAQRACRVKADTSSIDTSLTSGNWVTIEIDVDCEAENEIKYLEHVQAITSVEYSKRGVLEIFLTSPEGTEVQLLTERVGDTSSQGFAQWPFMSVHTWGEDPRGTWTLNISDTTGENENGSIGDIELILYGTLEAPKHMEKKRHYKIQKREEEREGREKGAEDDKIYLSAEQLRSLSWEQLVALLKKKSRSTLTQPETGRMLKKGGLKSMKREEKRRREKEEEEGEEEEEWKIILNEMHRRKEYHFHP